MSLICTYSLGSEQTESGVKPDRMLVFPVGVFGCREASVFVLLLRLCVFPSSVSSCSPPSIPHRCVERWRGNSPFSHTARCSNEVDARAFHWVIVRSLSCASRSASCSRIPRTRAGNEGREAGDALCAQSLIKPQDESQHSLNINKHRKSALT